ncbi:hypothetical protein J416_00659 [Gracilibacillus halophilus YIM-C55.5]|uniref:Uncharacterized protein n=1 Tax=Gracilibacillus halophilus YIM-C55.5 TaxID=1308866 RepID=N4WYT7_9BACI|nr:hypothetical protein [Gracilibacillus halophilus]ENH98211.1 hypothetical protein J416_00659 [Gracilibacillus halophilus YIM-C55.5]
MSWKSVEMQIALPRTQDAGKMQDLMQQQGRVMQNQLAQTIASEEIKRRKQVNQSDANEKANNDQEESETPAPLPTIKHQQKQQQEATKHPYLGKRFDFST